MTKISDGLEQRPATTGRGRSRPSRSPCRRQRALIACSCRDPAHRHAAPCRRGRGAHAQPGGVASGSQTTPSGMSVTTERQRDRAAVGGDRDAGRRRRSRPRPRSPPTAGRPTACAVPARCGSPSCMPAGVEQQAPGGQHRLAGGPAAAGAAPATVGAARAGPGPRPELGELARRGRRRRAARAATPSSSASMRQDPRVGHRERVPQHGLERARRGPPSRGTCRPSPSTAATGSTTSARSVTALAPDLQADHEAAPSSSAASAAAGSARSSGSTPPTTSAPSSPAAAAASDRRRCRGRARRAGASTPQAAADVDAGRGVGRPGGRRAAGSGSAPASTAPRSPARRGTQASRAPVAAASRAAAVSAPGTPAEPLADEDDRAGLAQRRPRPRDLARSVAASASSTAASLPGRGRQQRAAELGAARGVANGATDEHLRAALARRPCAAAGRRSATPPRARSRRAARPARPRGRRRSTPSPRAGDRARPGTSASSARVRPGPEVDVVGAERDPGELARRRRRPRRSAGRRPARRRRGRRGPPPGRGRRRRAPRARTARPARRRLVADQRSGEPVAAGGVVERPAALVAVPLLVDLAGRRRPAGAAPCRGGGRCAGAQPEAQCSHAVGRRDQVERAGPEAVRRAGQRADRADLHRVAGEVGVERLRRRRCRPAACAPRSSSSMNGSPAICVGEAGAARARARSARGRAAPGSRSGSAWGRCAWRPSKRDSPRPLDIAWFCSGHSPPLSQTGQSSGWLIEQQLHDARAAPCRRPAEVSWVVTTMPSATVVVQEASGFGAGPRPRPGTAGRRRPGRAAGGRRTAGSAMPSCSAARMTSVPLGTRDLDAVDGQRDEVVAAARRVPRRGRSS